MQYLPRGAGALKNDYSQEEHMRMCQSGLVDGGSFPPRNSISIGVGLHIHHVIANDSLVRFDDRRLLKITDVCLIDLDSSEGPMACRVLAFTIDDGKNNGTGIWRLATAMRHRDEPLLCSHFAVLLQTVCQHRLLGLEPSLADFVPVKRDVDGVLVRR